MSVGSCGVYSERERVRELTPYRTRRKKEKRQGCCSSPSYRVAEGVDDILRLIGGDVAVLGVIGHEETLELDPLVAIDLVEYKRK
jgi:hypothetical protein